MPSIVPANSIPRTSVLLDPLFNDSKASLDERQKLETAIKRKRSFSKALRQILSSLAHPISKRQRKFNECSSSLTPASIPLKAPRRHLTEELWAICCRIALNEPLHNPEVSAVQNIFHRQRLRIMLKTLDSTIHELQLPPPVSGAVLTGAEGVFGESPWDFVSQLPQQCRTISAKADPSGLVARLLPVNCINKEARYVGSAFWLWLCAIDDLTEDLQGPAYEESLEEVRRGFRGIVDESSPSDVGIASKAFFELVNSTRIYATNNDGSEDVRELVWRASFLDSVNEILCAFDAERPLLRTKSNGNNISLRDWMDVRVVTISARPFMILARASLGLNTTLTSHGYALRDRFGVDGKGLAASYMSTSTYDDNTDAYDSLERIEIITQCIMGLQNDILGWEKDHVERNPLNAIEILIDEGFTPFAATTSAIAVHNNLVDRVVKFASLIVDSNGSEGASSTASKESLEPVGPNTMDKDSVSENEIFGKEGHIRAYVEMLLGFSNGMAAWSSTCKRYVTA